MDKIMIQIQALLDEVKPLAAESERRQKNKCENGELFNVFSIMNAESNEVNTHSAILTELLNPNGSHGMKEKFLKTFLDTVGFCKEADKEFVLNKAIVEKEKYIGPISPDGELGGQLDIYIELSTKNNTKFSIIIENKIYAKNQPSQLERYKNFAENNFPEKYKIYYLTLYGSEPSENSTGLKNENKEQQEYWECISYQKEIKEWIKSCLSISVQRPLIRETLVQYIDLINKLTGQEMDSKMSEEIVDLMLKNPDATFAILKNEKAFGMALSDILSEQCSEIAEKYPEIELSNFDDIYFSKSNSIKFSIKKTPMYICFGHEGKIFCSIYLEHAKNRKNRLSCFNEDSGEDGYPYGYSWIKEYEHWDIATEKAILDGSFAKVIEEWVHKILDEKDKFLS